MAASIDRNRSPSKSILVAHSGSLSSFNEALDILVNVLRQAHEREVGNLRDEVERLKACCGDITTSGEKVASGNQRRSVEMNLFPHILGSSLNAVIPKRKGKSVSIKSVEVDEEAVDNQTDGKSAKFTKCCNQNAAEPSSSGGAVEILQPSLKCNLGDTQRAIPDGEDKMARGRALNSRNHATIHPSSFQDDALLPLSNVLPRVEPEGNAACALESKSHLRKPLCVSDGPCKAISSPDALQASSRGVSFTLPGSLPSFTTKRCYTDLEGKKPVSPIHFTNVSCPGRHLKRSNTFGDGQSFHSVHSRSMSPELEESENQSRRRSAPSPNSSSSLVRKLERSNSLGSGGASLTVRASTACQASWHSSHMQREADDMPSRSKSCPRMQLMADEPVLTNTSLRVKQSQVFDRNFAPWHVWVMLQEVDWDTLSCMVSPSATEQLGLKTSQSTCQISLWCFSLWKNPRENIRQPRLCLYTLLQCFVTHPCSIKRMMWIVLGIVLITYDLIVTPLGVFDMPFQLSEGQLHAISVFWLIDFILSFFVGYHHKSSVEMNLSRTARHYAKTWMTFDLTLISIDLVLIVISSLVHDNSTSSASLLRVGKALRTARTLRCLRLLRSAKIPTFFREVHVLVGRSEHASLILGILKHMFGILVITHIIACSWYAIGDGKIGGGQGWVREYLDVKEPRAQNFWLHYVISLQWSLTQFTPSTMDLHPQTLMERTFAVLVLLFAMVTFSSFVSSITNLMTHLRTLKQAEAKQFVKLEHYLQDNHISYHLSLRVRRYLEYLCQAQGRTPQEGDVEILRKLSEPLQMELVYEVRSPRILKHPFFQQYAMFNVIGMHKLCYEALKIVNLMQDDVLFSVGETARAMYFVTKGEMLYKKKMTSPSDRALSNSWIPIGNGQWACEAVLWTPWEHCGEMIAAVESSLFALDALKFLAIVQEHRRGLHETLNYACLAVDYMNEYKSIISDINLGTAESHLAAEAFTTNAIAENVAEGRTSVLRVPDAVLKSRFNPLAWFTIPRWISNSRNS